MKETIYTIPINEAFEAIQGCPVCGLRDAQETRWAEYITGGAMMEPDVRTETNRLGFCRRHFGHMLSRQNTRLPVALMISTRIGRVLEDLRSTGLRPDKSIKHPAGSCFICDRTEREIARMCENIAVIWAREDHFQELYIQQKFVCLNDFYELIAAGERVLRGKAKREFARATAKLAEKGASPLKSDIDAFCALYDYRSNQNAIPPEEVSTAIERSISWLSGK